MPLEDRQISTAYIYSIVADGLEEERIPDGIELYVKEIVKIRLELEELEQKTANISVSRHGVDFNKEFSNPFSAVWYLFKNIGDSITDREDIAEVEEEFQSLLDRISDVREAMIMGHLAPIDSISGDDYASQPTQRVMTKLLHNRTFPDEIEKLDSAAERVDRRLSSKQETANTKVALTTSMITVLITVLLLIFAALSFIVSLMSTMNVLL